jgi:hypothetical protein
MTNFRLTNDEWRNACLLSFDIRHLVIAYSPLSVAALRLMMTALAPENAARCPRRRAISADIPPCP